MISRFEMWVNIMNNEIKEDVMFFIFDWLAEHDQRINGNKLVNLFIKYSDNEDILSFFSKIVSHMNFNDFSYTLKYFISEYNKTNIDFSRDKKLTITLSILNYVKVYQNIYFYEYKEELIHIISGMAQWELENLNGIN